MNKSIYLTIILLFLLFLTEAALVIAISQAKNTGDRTMIKLDMKNTLSERIEGAKGKRFHP